MTGLRFLFAWGAVVSEGPTPSSMTQSIKPKGLGGTMNSSACLYNMFLHVCTVFDPHFTARFFRVSLRPSDFNRWHHLHAFSAGTKIFFADAALMFSIFWPFLAAEVGLLGCFCLYPLIMVVTLKRLGLSQTWYQCSMEPVPRVHVSCFDSILLHFNIILASSH